MHANTFNPDTDATDNLDISASPTTATTTASINSFESLPAAAITGTTHDGGIILDHTTFNLAVHDGMVTIHNPATGNHRTFRVRTQADGAKFAPGRRVVSLLTGPNREDPESWQSFGFVETDRNGDGDGGAYVRVWRKFDTATGAYPTFAKMLANPKLWAAKGAEYFVETRCRRCGRPLTTKESVTTGLGPVCSGRE